jgi:Mrp family chromosome partitioning ATPase
MFEDYYYWHEAAYFLAMQRKGWKVFLHPTARIVHVEGMGSGRRSPATVARHAIDFARGSLRFYCDHRGVGRADPRRWLAATALYGRAALLSAAAFVRGGGSGPAPFDRERVVRAAYGRLLQQLLAEASGRPRILLLTSVGAGEGVSSTVADLGQELALNGDAETLLVDANPDGPGLHHVLWTENGAGFSELLGGGNPAPTALPRRLADRLALLPHGHARYNLMTRHARERVESCLERLAEGRRFVLIDAPPLDRRTDALTLAPCVDGVILVVRAEATERDRVQNAAAELRAAGGEILGAVYNGKPFHIPEAIYRRV